MSSWFESQRVATTWSHVLNLLHVVYCAQLGIDKYVHVVYEVVEQLPPLSVERVSILLPSLLDLGSRRSSILCVVV